MLIGERIQTIRQEKKLKLIELQRRIKVMFGQRAIDYRTLRRIQSGETDPSEFSLYRISMGLGITLKELLEGIPEPLIKVIPKDKPEGYYNYTPVKATAEKLSTRKLKGLLAQKLTIAASATTRLEQDPSPLPDKAYQKWIYCLKGELIVSAGNEKITLKRGDCCFFDSHNPHYFENTSKKISQCLVLQSPPYL